MLYVQVNENTGFGAKFEKERIFLRMFVEEEIHVQFICRLINKIPLEYFFLKGLVRLIHKH